MYKLKQFVFILLTFFVTYLKADQLAWINKNSAIKATEFLNNHKDAILFCGCCQYPKKKKISIYTAKYSRATEDNNYYKVSISYENNGDSMAGYEDIDLAYIHTQINGLWISVGRALDMECDPCIEPFVFEVKDHKQNEEDVKIELLDWTGVYPILKTSLLDAVCESYKFVEERNTLTALSKETGAPLSFWEWDLKNKPLLVKDIDTDGLLDYTIELSNQGGGCGGNIGQEERWTLFGSNPKDFIWTHVIPYRSTTGKWQNVEK